MKYTSEYFLGGNVPSPIRVSFLKPMYAEVSFNTIFFDSLDDISIEGIENVLIWRTSSAQDNSHIWRVRYATINIDPM